MCSRGLELSDQTYTYYMDTTKDSSGAQNSQDCQLVESRYTRRPTPVLPGQ